MKRLRLLIYEYAVEDEAIRSHLEAQDAIKGTTAKGRTLITSIELNPFKITILELLRLFRREAKTK
jgi:hypothetical protein